MIRRMFATAILALSLATTGCDGQRPALTEFDQGFNSGIRAVREVRQKWGLLGNVAGQLGAIGPGDAQKSPNWNAGFRAGVKAELER